MTEIYARKPPAGWKKLQLKELARITAGGDYDPKTASEIETDHYPFPVYANAIARKAFHSYSSTSKHPAGAVTITARGAIGFAQFRDKPFTAIGRLLVVWPNSQFDGRYLAEYLNSQIQFAIESTGVPQLTGPQAGSYEILIPDNIAEQEAIAKALSDADALIEGLERLIAKKRLIKQGAMQELLTGKRRLPGVSGEWVERNLGSVAMLQRGFDLPNSVRTDGDFPVVYSNGIIATHTNFMCEGPGVITGRSGTIGNVTFVQTQYWPHNTALWVKNFFGNDVRFVFYLLQFIDLRRFASGSGVPTLNRNDAHADLVRVPIDVAEQVAIRSILDDINTEIQALETRLEKTQQVKEGMMQNLLTGRIRLV